MAAITQVPETPRSTGAAAELGLRLVSSSGLSRKIRDTTEEGEKAGGTDRGGPS